jgi:hypothetical protein
MTLEILNFITSNGKDAYIVNFICFIFLFSSLYFHVFCLPSLSSYQICEVTNKAKL